MPKNYAVETISSLPFGMLIGAPLNAAIDAQAQAAKATIDFIMTVGFMPASGVNAQNQVVADPDPVDVTRPDNAPAAGTDPATNAGQTRMVTFSYTTTSDDQAVVQATTDAVAVIRTAANPAAVNAALAAAYPNPTAQQTALMNTANNAAGAANATIASIIAAVTASTSQTATISVPLLSVVPIPFFSIDEMTIDFVAKITEAITANTRAQNQSVKTASASGHGGWGPVSGGFKAGMSSTHSSTSERSSKYQTELTMTIHVRASSESMPKGMGKVLDMLAGLIKSEKH